MTCGSYEAKKKHMYTGLYALFIRNDLDVWNGSNMLFCDLAFHLEKVVDATLLFLQVPLYSLLHYRPTMHSLFKTLANYFLLDAISFASYIIRYYPFAHCNLTNYSFTHCFAALYSSAPYLVTH